MPEFELDKVDWWTPIIIAETPNFDKDQYGNTWYSVVFEGDAGTHLWLAKNRPEEKKKYYGHFEKTKSGKAVRFKTDKVPEEEATPTQAASNFESVDRQTAISRSVALNNAVLLAPSLTVGPDERLTDVVLLAADELLVWLKNEEPITDPFSKNEEDHSND